MWETIMTAYNHTSLILQVLLKVKWFGNNLHTSANKKEGKQGGIGAIYFIHQQSMCEQERKKYQERRKETII